MGGGSVALTRSCCLFYKALEYHGVESGTEREKCQVLLLGFLVKALFTDLV